MAVDIKYLVGLTDSTCNCFVDGTEPVDYNRSDSGYYLTDYEDGLPLLDEVFSAANCGDGDVWDILTRGRDQAVVDFKTDLIAAMYQRSESRFQTFSGLIGKNETGSALVTSKLIAGSSVYPYMIKGAYLTVNRIGVALDSSETFDVHIYRRDYDDGEPELLYTDSVTSVAGQMAYTTLVAPRVLPLYVPNFESLYYYFVYTIPVGAAPLNNKYKCCSKVPLWTQYMKAGGVAVDNFSELGTSSSGYAYGVSLDAYINCDGLDWLYNLDTIGGYEPISVVAKTIQFKGAVKLISAILDSGNINFYTMSDREVLYGKRNHYQKRYQDNILWLASNIPDHVSDCLQCKKSDRFKKSSIIV